MNHIIKKILIAICLILTLLAIGFGAWMVYDFVIEDATKRIQDRVAQGVKKGVGEIVNPFKWLKFKPKDK